MKKRSNDGGRVTVYRLKAVKVRSLVCKNLCSVVSPAQIAEIVYPIFHELDRECMVILYLDTYLNPIGVEVVAVGGTSFCPVEIKNVFKGAILANASAIAVCHNHISCNLKPSMEDEKLTRAIIRAGGILGVKLIDHLIIGDYKQYYSFRENEKMYLENETN